MERRLLEAIDVERIFILVLILGTSLGAAPIPHGSVSSLTFSISSEFKNGSPISDQNIRFTVTLDGRRLFPAPAGNTTPAVARGDRKTNSSGASLFSFPVSDATAANDANTHLSPAVDLRRLERIRMDVSIPASVGLCESYCSSSGPSDSASCVSRCSQGHKILSASKTLTLSELAAIEGAPGFSGNIAWSGTLTFVTLGSASKQDQADLVVDANITRNSLSITREWFDASTCDVLDGCVNDSGWRTLLRFSTGMVNAGSADLELGSPVSNPLMTYNSCRGGYYFKNMMLYELLSSRTHRPVAVGIASGVVGNKDGFCVMDGYIAQNGAKSSATYNCSNQGISVGWADVYSSSMDCQWLDITDVPNGHYVLRLIANPDGLFPESDTGNNTADVPLTIQ